MSSSLVEFGGALFDQFFQMIFVTLLGNNQILMLQSARFTTASTCRKSNGFIT